MPTRPGGEREAAGQAMVRTESRGRTLGRVTGERAVRKSQEKAAQSSAAGESILSVIEDSYGTFASDAVKKLAEENISFHPEFNGDSGRFAQEVIGPNWYARMMAYTELTGAYGFEEVQETTSTDTLSQAMWVGLSESGTMYMFGPRAVFGRNDRGDATGQEDGMFAFRYIDGRQGGVSRQDGSKIPAEVGVATPNNKARIFVYEPVEFVEEQTGNIVKTEWHRDENGQDLPLEGTSLTINSYTPNGESRKIDTSALLRVFAVQNPTDVKGLFDAFGEAVKEIDRRTLVLTREGEEQPQTRRRTGSTTIVVPQSGETE